MKLTSLFFALILVGVLASPAWAANGPGKGGHGNGNLLLASGMAPAGQATPFTSVNSNQSVVACSNRPSVWANPLHRSNWVSLQADCTTNLNVGDYTYNTTFTLRANRPGLTISGRVLADDSVTIQLNGHTIMNSGGNLSSPTAFSSSDSSFFTTGTNTLTFIVHNNGGPSGLDYVARVRHGHGPASGQSDNDDNDGDGD